MDIVEEIKRDVKNGKSDNEVFEKVLKNYYRKHKPTVNNYLTRQEFYEHKTELLRQVCRYAVENEKIRSKRDIRNMDMIDITGLDGLVEMTDRKSSMPMIALTDEEIEFSERSWYNIIPPLQRGVIRFNANRYVQYLVGELNEENKGYSLVLVDYTQDDGIWLINQTATVFLSEDGYGTYETHTAYDVLSLVDMNEMNWSKKDKDFWKDYCLPSFAVSAEVTKEEGLKELIMSFKIAVIKTNYLLSQNKPKAERKRKGVVKAVVAPENERKKQIVRNVGAIKIRSVDIPRVQNAETIRKYKVAAWNTRGHVRHLKSGKEVYVKPSVHHRKCMQDDGSVATTVIQIKK